MGPDWSTHEVKEKKWGRKNIKFYRYFLKIEPKWFGSEYPDPRQNKNRSGSAQKCHGSATLEADTNLKDVCIGSNIARFEEALAQGQEPPLRSIRNTYGTRIITVNQLFRIQIHFFRIRIQDFFPNPDPDSGSGYRQQKTNNFSKAKTKFWEKFLFSTQKVGILFLFSTNQVGRYFIEQRTFIW